MKVTEAQLEVEFQTASDIVKFDSLNQLTHSLKGVDFIVTLPDRYIFLEIKDPQNPNAKPEDVQKSKKKFNEELQSENRSLLKSKCCDTLLYKLATQDIEWDKPIYYYVLIAFDPQNSLDNRLLLNLLDYLKKALPIVIPGGRGKVDLKFAKQKTRFIQGCGVFNIETWNQHLSSSLGATVRRLPNQ